MQPVETTPTHTPHAAVPGPASNPGPFPGAHQRRRRLRRLSTGKLLFLILSLALAPLGAIAMAASVRTIMQGDQERSALLRVAAQQYASQSAHFLGANAGRLKLLIVRVTGNRDEALARSSIDATAPPAPLPPTLLAPADPALPVDPALSADPALGGVDAAIAPLCTAVARAFNGRDAAHIAVQIVDGRTGANMCVAGVPMDDGAIARPIGSVRIDERQHLVIHTIAAIGANARAEIVYPHGAIANSVTVDAGLPLHTIALATADARLPLREQPDWRFSSMDIDSASPVGHTGLKFELSAKRTWFSGSELISLLTPMGMWFLAVLLSWLVVDRILLTPIQQLRRRMDDYHPGDPLGRQSLGLFAAAEVAALDGNLDGLTQAVAIDKMALARGLEAQRALTREVHHRVKNNLQIIASLINLHSRDATDESAHRAYRTIQRRVDALAVVHRHLHADTEGQPGIALGTMLGELAVGLRNSLTQSAGPTAMSINVDAARASQDAALPVAFFVTELVELAVAGDAGQPITIALDRACATPGHALLSVTSAGLRACADCPAGNNASYDRVLTGLARQLRQELVRDGATGRFAIAVPVLD
ncbi:MAG: sensor histidine kinase [Sphingopyxis sp.]